VTLTTTVAVRARRAHLIALALLAGCHVGPNYKTPAPPADSETSLVSFNPKLETAEQTPDAWWRLYSDPRLDTLVQEALTANRDLAAADANLSAARAALSAVRANRLPQTEVVAGAVYGRDPQTDEILELTGRHPKTIWLYEDLFEVAYEVDLFGRVHRSVEASSANAEAVAATRDSVRVLVAAATTNDYAAICTLGEELEVARRSLDIATHEADITQQRYEAGGNSQLDVARAQALASQVRASIPQFEGARKAALFELTAFLGRTPTHAPAELETCATAPHLSALIPIGDGRELIRRRPDVRQAERRLAAATAQIGVATAELYPSIQLLGFYGGAATRPAELTTNAGTVWGVGPRITWAFPNQAGPRARVRQAKASQVAALASFDSVVLTALKETEQALAQYSAALDRRQALADAQTQIHRAFDIARDEYLAGSVSNLDLLTTEQSMVATDAAVASQDATLVQLQIAVFKALGGGWHGESQGQPDSHRDTPPG
jgi:NodT family efflux transporter outer membrane factor (OMF) lipoprotein